MFLVSTGELNQKKSFSLEIVIYIQYICMYTYKCFFSLFLTDVHGDLRSCRI